MQQEKLIIAKKTYLYFFHVQNEKFRKKKKNIQKLCFYFPRGSSEFHFQDFIYREFSTLAHCRRVKQMKIERGKLCAASQIHHWKML